MAQPYNYSLNVPSPMQAFGQAFNVGAAGQRARLAREARESRNSAKGNRKACWLKVILKRQLDQRTSEDHLTDWACINPQIRRVSAKSI